jgi:hypothetical protein
MVKVSIGLQHQATDMRKQLLAALLDVKLQLSAKLNHHFSLGYTVPENLANSLPRDRSVDAPTSANQPAAL